MTDPTEFPELNALLDRFVSDARAALDGDLVGLYLQGSFAIGDADEHSDVDFLAITRRPVDEAAQERLQQMHADLFALPTAWAQHLEGSYATADQIRVVDPLRTPWLYLDNGASELVWNSHCNTAVVRWCLRESGVPLSGPPAGSLVEPVSQAVLVADLRLDIAECAAWAHTPDSRFASGMSEFKQQFLVQFMCRAHHATATGTVVSKRRASEWAIDELEPRWLRLIQSALDNRADPWGKVNRGADVELAAETLAFVAHSGDRMLTPGRGT